MDAPVVVVAILTVCGELYVPVPGVKVGVAAGVKMVYVAGTTLLFARPVL